MSEKQVDLTECFGKHGKTESCPCDFSSMCKHWTWNVLNKKGEHRDTLIALYVLVAILAAISPFTILGYSASLILGCFLGGLITGDIVNHRKVHKLRIGEKFGEKTKIPT